MGKELLGEGRKQKIGTFPGEDEARDLTGVLRKGRLQRRGM